LPARTRAIAIDGASRSEDLTTLPPFATTRARSRAAGGRAGARAGPGPLSSSLRRTRESMGRHYETPTLLIEVCIDDVVHTDLVS
jgi:hypothetical protein